MANVLRREKQEAAISALAEGVSIRSIERMIGVHRDTIMRLGVRVGEGCARIMDQRMKSLSCRHVEVDEIWGFVGKKQARIVKTDSPELGDVWTFTAIDPETKLVPVYRVGKRDLEHAEGFMKDLQGRLKNRVQLSSDAMRSYVEAVERAFGPNVDYAQIVKSYTTPASERTAERKYSPPDVVSVERIQIMGNPDMNKVCTSYVERQNLTMRMHMRRLTRLTNAFSKKLDNFKAAVALHFCYYNFVKIHRTIRMTPAMAAGVESRLWSVGDMLDSAA